MDDDVRVLIVEDDVELANAYAVALWPRPVDHVATCEAARAAIASSSYSVAVVDLRLPDGRGTDVLEELREKAPGCTLVLWTAYPSARVSAQAARARARFLLKPPRSSVDPDILEVILAEIASARARAGGTEALKIELAHRLADRARLAPEPRKILVLLAQGLAIPEMADESGKSSRTISNQLQDVYDGLGPDARERSVAALQYRMLDILLAELLALLHPS